MYWRFGNSEEMVNIKAKSTNMMVVWRFLQFQVNTGGGCAAALSGLHQRL